jgi:orotidine-5'-phosphate decarboxylase
LQNMKKNSMEPALEDRIIVAADFDPDLHGGFIGVQKRLLTFLEEFNKPDVPIKVEGLVKGNYQLIYEMRTAGVRKVFADLKLSGTFKTLESEARILREFSPDILTVMCNADIRGLARLKEILGDKTEVFGVTVLTSANSEECYNIYDAPPKIAVVRLARRAVAAGLDGIVLGGPEVEMIRSLPEFDSLKLVVPAVRPSWCTIPDDDQARTITISEAIMSGADQLVMGRSIMNASPHERKVPRLPMTPAEALEWSQDEVSVTLSKTAS